MKILITFSAAMLLSTLAGAAELLETGGEVLQASDSHQRIALKTHPGSDSTPQAEFEENGMPALFPGGAVGTGAGVNCSPEFDDNPGGCFGWGVAQAVHTYEIVPSAGEAVGDLIDFCARLAFQGEVSGNSAERRAEVAFGGDVSFEKSTPITALPPDSFDLGGEAFLRIDRRSGSSFNYTFDTFESGPVDGGYGFSDTVRRTIAIGDSIALQISTGSYTSAFPNGGEAQAGSGAELIIALGAETCDTLAPRQAVPVPTLGKIGLLILSIVILGVGLVSARHQVQSKD
ncbi:MAG: hypothetical protein AAGH19_11535 [Pseudomonadota bacterium]